MKVMAESVRSYFAGVVNAVASSSVMRGGRDSSYFGASHSARELAGWEASAGSPDTDIEGEVEDLRERARDLDRNNPMASNIRVTKNDNVIGTGLQCQPDPNWVVLEDRLREDEDWLAEWGKKGVREWHKWWSKRIRAHWNDYCNSRFFDADGEDNFHLQSKLMYDSRHLSGSATAVPMWKVRPGTPYRTCIKVIESDRLCDPTDMLDTSKISNGVERDRSGAVVAYHITNRHPGDDNTSEEQKWKRIPAYTSSGRPRFLHLYERSRPGQSRGVPVASNALAEFGLLGKYRLTELQAAVVNSNIAGIMTTDRTDQEAAAMFGGKPEDYAKLRGRWNGKLTAGMILKMPPGTSFSSHTPNRPATAYAGFIQQVSREIGVGANLPLELSTRDFSKLNYASIRAALQECWRHFRVERMTIFHRWATPCFALWLEEHIDLGITAAPGFYEFRSAWTRCRWLAPEQDAVDAMKAANADKIRLETDTTTLMDIYAANGEDWEDKSDQRTAEKIKKLEEKYRLAEAEAQFREAYKVELPTPTPPDTEEDEEDPPESDEEVDEQDNADEQEN